MTTTVPHRSEIAVEHTWDASSIFATDAAWEAALEELNTRLDAVTAFQGRLAEGPATLLEALQQIDEISNRLGKIYVYASMFHEVDTADQAAIAKINRAKGAYGQVVASTSFIEPELIAIGFETLERWTRDEPGLAVYAHSFDEIKTRQAHVRSAEVEQVIGMALDPFFTASATHGILADADLRFEPAVAADGSTHEITHGTIGALISDPDRQLRRSAWENYADAHTAFKNTMANALATGVKQHVFTARVRNYSSSVEAALSDSFIPVEVFHQLVETCNKHLPVWHRYWQLRRKALGYDDFHVYDIKAPLTQQKVNIPFDRAYDMIAAGMAPLGDEYITPMTRGVREQRWVDIYPNKGKRAGAFSSGYKGTHPFILMNYNDDVFGLSTLAHELGHSMHSYFAWQNQPQPYSSYTIFVAEVASNFNQALVRDHLFRTVEDRDFQIALIEEAMSNFHRYFFIMPILAQFELQIHERAERGQPLTADVLNGLMLDLFRQGYGDHVAIDAERIGITWAQFPTHLYANFYVYQYATGIAGAHAIADKVLAGEAGARDNYMRFLKAGSSLYPLDALKLAGVDLTSAEPVEKAYGVLSSMVDRLEKLI